jgi:hypothetical protein
VVLLIVCVGGFCSWLEWDPDPTVCGPFTTWQHPSQVDAEAARAGWTITRTPRYDRPPFRAFVAINTEYPVLGAYVLEFKDPVPWAFFFGKRLWRITEWIRDEKSGALFRMPGRAYGEAHNRYYERYHALQDTSPEWESESEVEKLDEATDTITLEDGGRYERHFFATETAAVREIGAPNETTAVQPATPAVQPASPSDSPQYEDLTSVGGENTPSVGAIGMTADDFYKSFGDYWDHEQDPYTGLMKYAYNAEHFHLWIMLRDDQVCWAGYQNRNSDSIEDNQVKRLLKDNSAGNKWQKSEYRGNPAWRRSDNAVVAYRSGVSLIFTRVDGW